MRKYIINILFWINVLAATALLLSYLSNYISPADVWLMAFFGLAYPFLLIVNFSFFIFWMIKRKMFAVISFIIILAGIENIGRYVQSGMFHKMQVQKGVHILSYNVRIFNQYNWEKGGNKRDDILGFVLRQNSDIVCFQEFLTRENYPLQSRQSIDKKLSQLPFSHVYYTVRGKNSNNYGIATYTKYPILNKGLLKFTNSYNACIFTDVLIKKDTVRIFNVHLESIKLVNKDYNFMDSIMYEFNSKRFIEAKEISGRLKRAYIKRSKQVDALENLISKSPYPVIICGDFNDTPVSYTYEKAKGPLEDAFMESGSGIGGTYRGIFPSYRIDFIFHSKSMNAINYKTHNIPYSDHFPVSCELIL